MCNRIFSDLRQRISIQELQKKLSEWHTMEKIKQLLKSLNFKYPTRQLYGIKEEFYTCAIKYVCLKELFWIFYKDVSPELIKTNSLVKQLYCNIKKIQAKDHLYNMLLIVITKASVSFMNKLLVNIEIGTKIQSQIFIVFQYLLLGLKVSSQTYNLIIQRYISKQTIKFSQRKEHHSTKLLTKQKAKTYKRTKYLKRSRSSDITEQFLKFKNHQQQEFVSEVKENLNVKTFPKIIHRNKTLEDIINVQQQKFQHNYFRDFCNKKFDLQVLSSSMQKNMTENQLKQNQSKKTAKLSFRPSIKSNKVQVQMTKSQKENGKSSNITIDLQKQQNKTMSITHWQKVIQGLKDYPIFKCDLQSYSIQQDIINTITQKSTYIPNRYTTNSIKQKSIFIAENDNHLTVSNLLANQIRNISQDRYSSQQNLISQYLNVFKRNNIHKSSFLKKQKKQFQVTCIDRLDKIRATSLMPIGKIK